MPSPRERRASRSSPGIQPRNTPAQANRTIFNTFGHLGVSVIHPAGSVLFEEGGPTTGIYLVREGQIKLSCSAGRERSMILRIAQTGEILGLSAVLNGCGHEMTAKALTDCDLVHIAAVVFMDFLKGFAEAGTQALVALAKDHREVFLSARRLALFPLASSRMAQVLIALSHAGSAGETSPRFSMLLTHSELASLIGTTRETVTRVLNDLERQKIIARNEMSVTILKPAKLAQLAH